MIKNVIFDLDGTLTDPKTGIVNGLQLAFSQYGISLENPEDYEAFIGPALRDFMPRRFPGRDDETYDAIVKAYRAYYGEKGKFENEPYPGIEEALERLSSAGMRLAVATSKPKVFADEILEHFGLLRFFEYVAGPPLYHTSSDKSSLIRECIEALSAKADETIMVGDRKYDIDGAHSAGIRCAAALYGYGPPEEAAAADCAAATPNALANMLIGMSK